MQQNTFKLTTFLTIGLSIGFFVLLALIYRVEITTPIENISSKKSTADYFIHDDQQYFKHGLNDTNTFTLNKTVNNCDCNLLFSTENVTTMKHGENSPVFVPESLSPIEPDILDKILENRHDDGILVTVAGYALKYELFNWIEHLKQVKEENYVVFCTDMHIYTLLIVTGFEDKAIFIPDSWFLNDLNLFRNTTLNLLDNNRLSHIKTWILQRLVYIEEINNVIMLDLNQIILHSRTIEYIQTLLHIRWDTQLVTTQDDSNQKMINAGLLMLRTNAGKIKRLIANTIQIQESFPYLNQQEALNKALDQLDLHVKSGMVVLLDIIHFPNGIHYFEKNLSNSKGIEPYIIHANHKFGQERNDMLKEHGFWKVNQDYINAMSDQVDRMIKHRESKQELSSLNHF